MHDLLELPDSPSLFSLSCKVATGRHEPVINKLEANTVKFTCNNPLRKNIVTCSDDHLDKFLNEADGLGLNTILTSTIPLLPYYIPVFDKKLDIIPNLPEDFSFVGLSLKDTVSGGISHKAGCIHEEKSVGLKPFLLHSPCFKNKKVILFSSGPDTLIESIWYKRDEVDYFSRIAQMGFYAATGFNFSLFIGECPFAQQLNMKRSLMSSSLYEHAGILTIPHIYALTHYQVERWCDWLKLNPHINYFTVNCQLQTSRIAVTQVIQAVKEIFKFVPNVHAILHGFPISHVKDFGYEIARIHFADSQPHKRARNYRRLVFLPNELKIRIVKDDSVTISELITNNFIQRLTYLTEIKRLLLHSSG